MVPVVGSIAGPLAKKIGLGKKKKSVSAGNVNLSAGGVSAGGLSAGGISAGGLSAGGLSAGAKPKRKYAKKNGAGILDIMSKVANVSPFTNVTSGNPLSQLFGDDNVRNIAAKIATKVMGGEKKTRGRPKKVKGKKSISDRAKIVKQIMQEKGLKMIEASKYVKEHGLF
jgi:hypothetical protein